MPVPWIIVVGVLWVAVLALAVMVAGLSTRLRQFATDAANQPRAGAPQGSPFVVGPPIDIQLTLPPALSPTSQPDAASGAIFLFLHGSCGPCRSFWDTLSVPDELDLQLHGIRRTLITDHEGEALFASSMMTNTVVQVDDEISRALQINASPYGIALDSDGFVRWSGVPHTRDDLLAMAKALGRPREELLQTVWSPIAPA
ncbi:MAG: hypothetical protein ACLP50_08515 [Solirubrobacteraceae bacterium]